jgi:hypothetical protein
MMQKTSSEAVLLALHGQIIVPLCRFLRSAVDVGALRDNSIVGVLKNKGEVESFAFLILP